MAFKNSLIENIKNIFKKNYVAPDYTWLRSGIFTCVAIM